MAKTLTRCPDCGRLFGSRPGVIRCSACEAEGTGQNSRADEVRNGAILSPVESVGDSTSTFSGNVPCVRCGKHPVQAGSDFCLECRLVLNRAFGDATDELFAKFAAIEYEPRVPHPANAADMVSALREKRSRSGLRVEDLAPQRGLI